MSAKVLFVCVENSCRSQIAEGFARRDGAGVLEPASAGSRPSGKINPTAIDVMKELGIDLTRQASKGLSAVPGTGWDYVITMGCGDACPFVPSRATRDWAISDPKQLPLDEFRKVRDQIGRKVKELIDEVGAGRRS
ncbi:MAG: arsenate reductase ArsC [Elusimicrobia bacterium]|nr:arsenate reductase ArsC [Elusimicrobiota bacterium]